MLPTVVMRWPWCYSYFCGFVVFTTGRFMLSLVLFFVLVFIFFFFFFVVVVFFFFGLVITSLGEERAGLCSSHAFVCLVCTRRFVSFFSSSWCRGLAAAYDCGTPFTFLLTFCLV